MIRSRPFVSAYFKRGFFFGEKPNYQQPINTEFSRLSVVRYRDISTASISNGICLRSEPIAVRLLSCHSSLTASGVCARSREQRCTYKRLILASLFNESGFFKMSRVIRVRRLGVLDRDIEIPSFRVLWMATMLGPVTGRLGRIRSPRAPPAQQTRPVGLFLVYSACFKKKINSHAVLRATPVHHTPSQASLVGPRNRAATGRLAVLFISKPLASTAS